jgi:hypothetical protein
MPQKPFILGVLLQLALLEPMIDEVICMVQKTEGGRIW